MADRGRINVGVRKTFASFTAWSYAVAVTFTAVGLVLLLIAIASSAGWLDDLGREVGAVILTIGLIAFPHEAYLRRTLSGEILDAVEAQAAPILSAVLHSAGLQAAGIEAITVSPFDWHTFFAGADELHILPAVPNDAWLEGEWQALVDTAAQCRLDVCVYLPRSAGPHLSGIALRLRLDPADASLRLDDLALDLADRWRRAIEANMPLRSGGHLRILRYEAIPTIGLSLRDSRCAVTVPPLIGLPPPPRSAVIEFGEANRSFLHVLVSRPDHPTRRRPCRKHPCTMNADLTTVEFSTPDVISLIASGRMTLADFQRGFEWTDADVRSYVATLIKGWPAGSLLMVNGKPEGVDPRAFEHGGAPTDPPDYTVLDGQQRLTSLYFALAGVGPNVYAISAAALLSKSIDTIETTLRVIPRQEWDANYRYAPWQERDGLIPLYSLRTPDEYFAWRDAVVANARPELRREIALELSDLYVDVLSTVHRYKLSTVVLSGDLEEGAVARIFERLNRRGQRLGSFDLVVARVYERNWNLRTHWEDAHLEFPALESFLGEDGLPVLQAISLRREERDVRQSAVLDLPRALIHDQWEATAHATNDAVEFLMDECGVRRVEWLPYRSFVVILAALAMDLRSLGAYRDTIRAWFFVTNFQLTV